jgi:putative endonuclease
MEISGVRISCEPVSAISAILGILPLLRRPWKGDRMDARSRQLKVGQRKTWQPVWRILDILRQFRERRALAATQALGRKGEDMAHRFLRGKGFHILARRFRLADGSGEIDIIGRHGELIVFVEVKTRQTSDFGGPERALGREKEIRLVRAARSYLLKAGADWSQARFDIVTVVVSKPPKVSHYPDAFFPRRAI